MKESVKDVKGNYLKVGDTVRIIGVPDLSGMTPECLQESLPIFEYLVGKYKKIVGFNTIGGIPPQAEFDFPSEDRWCMAEPLGLY
ncbi:MAG: hypothetical protein WD708_10850 [Kiritimatiellia bacterium]